MTTLEQVRQRAESDAKSHGYYLNPDSQFLTDLLEGLKKNEDRYGYPSCPCRLASGKLEADRDIICPCDYRDIDVEEHGYCYCALFVRRDVYEGDLPITPIPERRPKEKIERGQKTQLEPSAQTRATTSQDLSAKPKMWYCKQCGYVVFREEPPYLCPICKAKREMFAQIKIAFVSL
ncbi:ferredoxin-thioredoxin reductase catalytic domain-containing protein [[Eubacterium] cellulosolvens]